MDSEKKSNSPWLIGLSVAASIATILGFLVGIGVIKVGSTSKSDTQTFATPRTSSSPTPYPTSTLIPTETPAPSPTPKPPTPTSAPTSYVVNDSDSSITYVAYINQWQYNGSRGLGDINDDVHYLYGDSRVGTPTTGGGGAGYIEFSFTGTGIDYITERESDEGRVGIYLDGSFVESIDCYNQTRLVQQVIYRVDNLSKGNHTIRIIANASGATLLDAFRVYY